MLRGLHHVAVICSDYAVSKALYVEVLGLRVLAENYREARDSWKLDLALPDGAQIELFPFPDAPPRPSWPEARGLRHLAFAVDGLDDACTRLSVSGVTLEPLRTDPFTGQRSVFFSDSDGLPLELYEAAF